MLFSTRALATIKGWNRQVNKTSENLLEINNLKMYYFGTHNRVTRAVDGVSMTVREQEVVGLVGESGCGKSATGLSIMRLTPSPPGRIIDGSIKFRGLDLAQAKENEINKIRGKDISMVFQDPMTCLNPSYTVYWQIAEAINAHEKLSKSETWDRVIKLLKAVGIAAPEQRAKEFPHRLSGGMRQRVMIASAIALKPKLLIADEPTTALDVTVQAQILDLLRSLQKEFQMSVVLISHNLGVVAEMAQRVIVMYAGQVIEEAPVSTLFAKPFHPYTEALLESIPGHQEPKSVLRVIPGKVPDMLRVPKGCRFHPRCKYVEAECLQVEPELSQYGENHWVRCLRTTSIARREEGQVV